VPPSILSNYKCENAQDVITLFTNFVEVKLQVVNYSPVCQAVSKYCLFSSVFKEGGDFYDMCFPPEMYQLIFYQFVLFCSLQRMLGFPDTENKEDVELSLNPRNIPVHLIK
jgi:hypothetical protein